MLPPRWCGWWRVYRFRSASRFTSHRVAALLTCSRASYIERRAGIDTGLLYVLAVATPSIIVTPFAWHPSHQHSAYGFSVSFHAAAVRILSKINTESYHTAPMMSSHSANRFAACVTFSFPASFQAQTGIALQRLRTDWGIVLRFNPLELDNPHPRIDQSRQKPLGLSV